MVCYLCDRQSNKRVCYTRDNAGDGRPGVIEWKMRWPRSRLLEEISRAGTFSVILEIKSWMACSSLGSFLTKTYGLTLPCMDRPESSDSLPLVCHLHISPLDPPTLKAVAFCSVWSHIFPATYFLTVLTFKYLIASTIIHRLDCRHFHSVDWISILTAGNLCLRREEISI